MVKDILAIAVTIVILAVVTVPAVRDALWP